MEEDDDNLNNPGHPLFYIHTLTDLEEAKTPQAFYTAMARGVRFAGAITQSERENLADIIEHPFKMPVGRPNMRKEKEAIFFRFIMGGRMRPAEAITVIASEMMNGRETAEQASVKMETARKRYQAAKKHGFKAITGKGKK